MSHTIKFGDQQGASGELPTNGRLWVGCGSRGVIIAEVRLGLVGAVAVDVGPWWKGGGWAKISVSLQARGSLGNSVRRLSEVVNVRGEGAKALGLSEPSVRFDIVYACRYARGTR